MSKRRLPSAQHKTSVIKKSNSLQVKKFVGVSMAGGKTNKSAVAMVEYYPKQKKLFLSQLHTKIESTHEESADLKIHNLLTESIGPIHKVAFDVPLTLPKCMRCRLKCPGYEACKEPEIKWLWKHYAQQNKKKRPKKIFTPYTERCAEYHIATQLEEVIHPSHALGANLAPLVARAQFIKRRIKLKCIEVYPRLSLWRIGRSLGIQKSYLRFHKHSVEGVTIRNAILEKLTDKNVAFLYTQDMKAMIDDANAFEAFLCALTAVFSFVKQCEKKPKGFPAKAPWVDFPVEKIDWDFLDFKKISESDEK